MIGTLARKRTNWAALAVLAALVAALFAVTISSQSATHKIVSTNDTDFVIADGGSITVQVEAIASPGSADTAYTFGEIFGFVKTESSGVATYRHQAGGPTGDFTITATNAGQSVSQKLVVGEPGTNLATVSVNLDTTNADGTARAEPTADGAKAETDTVAANGLIFINVAVKNSLGNASNIGAAADNADLDVIVFAVGGTVAQGDSAAATTSATGNSTTVNTIDFVVSRATAGTVEVFATATIGSKSIRTTESLILKFSGGPDAISAGDVSGGLLAPATAGAANTGFVSFEVTSVDAAGSANTATDTADTALQLDPSDLATKITNADGEDVTAKFDVDESAKKTADAPQSTTAGETHIDESKISDGAIAIVIGFGTAPGVPGGTYTAAVTLTGKNTVSVDFHVVGKLATLTAEADSTTVVEDGEFTVTATLVDANGLPVADGKADVEADATANPPVVAVDNSGDDVEFEVIGGDLAVFGQDSTERGQMVTKEVKGGTASATFYVTGDSGKAIVIVRSGGKTARVTVSTADAGGAAAADEVGIDCLSELSSHSTWTCTTGANAADVFAELASRGASALWLYNGTSWVRYATRDGEELPGSTNFAIRQYDSLYVSGS